MMSTDGARLGAVSLAAALGMWIACTCAGAAHAAGSFPNPADATSLAARAAAEGSVHVIVGLGLPAGKFTPEGAMSGRAAVDRQRRDIARARLALTSSLAGLGVRAYASWNSLPYVALEVDAAALAALADSDLVTAIVADTLARPTLDSAMPHIGAGVTYAAGYGGAGQTVVIIDTGIDADHPFFGGRVVDEACFSASAGGASLCPNGTASQLGAGAADALTTQCLFGGSSICDHGVHVAGIAAGQDPGLPSPAPGGIDGVAPDANIIAIQVFSRFDSAVDCSPAPAPCVGAWTSDMMSALDHVNDTLRLAWSIASVNMSLGGGMFGGACNGDPVKPAVDNLLSNGIATVIASGNDGWTDALGSPGCISTAVTVGSANDPSDAVTSFTNMNAVVDLLAPGLLVTSSVPDDAYDTFSGTSMATPVVTGAFAVLRAEAPAETVADLLSVLQTTGVAVTDMRAAEPPGAATGTTKSRVQLDDALDTIVSAVCGNGMVEFGEDCDSAPGTCPTGVCDPDCTCEDPVCGNDIVEEGETCDGLSDAACPGLCAAPGGFDECLCPDPDVCSSARIIPALPYTDALDTTTATIGAGDPILCGSGTQPQGHSVWYQLVAPGDGTVIVDTFGSTYDTVLAALQGPCGGLSLLTCNDDFGGGLQSQIAVPVAAGQTYRLEVTDYGLSAGGNLVLHAQFVSACGDGDLDSGEDCDDGNNVGGDCCASDCTFEGAGNACDDADTCTDGDACDGAGQCAGPVITDCDDGDPCTQDSCLGVGLCSNADEPAQACLQAGRSLVKVKDNASPAKDSMKWKWLKGAFVSDLELGSPTVDTDYTLCVYDETGGVPSIYMGRTLSGGSAGWVYKGAGKGFQYKEKLGTNDGFVKVKVRPGDVGRSQAQVQLKGVSLALPGPNAGSDYFDQNPYVTIQLRNDDEVCWSTEFTPLVTKQNDAGGFSAKTP